VTGGTTGIGRAIAILLASYGVKVFTCGRHKEHLDDALARIREVGDGDGLAVDLSKPKDVDRFFAAADDYLGGIDIAVINAAVPADALAETSEKDTRYQLETDFVSYLITAQEAAKRMKGGSDIILIGSMSAVSRKGGSSIYVAAKSGIQAFAASLRQELAEQDIKVCLIEPGFTGADFQYPDFLPEAARSHSRTSHAARRGHRRGDAFHADPAPPNRRLAHARRNAARASVTLGASRRGDARAEQLGRWQGSRLSRRRLTPEPCAQAQVGNAPCPPPTSPGISRR